MGEKSCDQAESPQEAAQGGLLSPTALQVPVVDPSGQGSTGRGETCYWERKGLNGASENPNLGGFASEQLSLDTIPALVFEAMLETLVHLLI